MFVLKHKSLSFISTYFKSVLKIKIYKYELWKKDNSLQLTV